VALAQDAWLLVHLTEAAEQVSQVSNVAALRSLEYVGAVAHDVPVVLAHLAGHVVEVFFNARIALVGDAPTPSFPEQALAEVCSVRHLFVVGVEWGFAFARARQYRGKGDADAANHGAACGLFQTQLDEPEEELDLLVLLELSVETCI
jgi:hypothetical protein